MNVQEELAKLCDLYLCLERDLVGKVVAQVYGNGDYVVIRFTDGTYTGFAGDSSSCEEDPPTIDFERPDVYALYGAGVVSKELYLTWLQEEEERKREVRKRQWKELSEEFGQECSGK